MNNGFYYLHSEGNLIFKPTIVADDPGYFNSPFVKKVWRLDTNDRLCAWTIILEALSMGCSIDRAKELSNLWKLTLDDSIEMLKRAERDKVTSAMKEGLEIFIREILGMEIEAFWVKVKENWNKD